MLRVFDKKGDRTECRHPTSFNPFAPYAAEAFSNIR
jgi:hypothetical protein